MPPGRGEVDEDVGFDREQTEETHWDVGGSITNSTKITAGGEAFGGSIEESISVTVDSSGGAASTSSKNVHVGTNLKATPDPEGHIKGVVLAEQWEGDLDVWRKLKNKRTGEITKQKGEIHLIYYQSRGKVEA